MFYDGSSEMKKEEFLVWKSPEKGVFIHDGQHVSLPEGWVQIPSGDAGLTRRLKAAGEYRVLVHMRRNRMEAIGLWVPEKIADQVRAELEKERSDPAWQKKLNASRRMRERKQAEYEKEFREAVLKFLAFDEKWSAFAEKLADAVTAHAVPVGSGTVARTQLIPLEQRAEAAVIAWMRHQTTAYDRMSIARIKGERRKCAAGWRNVRVSFSRNIVPAVSPILCAALWRVLFAGIESGKYSGRFLKKGLPRA